MRRDNIIQKLEKIPVSLKIDEDEVDSYDLAELPKHYYDKLGVAVDEVQRILPKFVDVPGHVYDELGVARPTHPTGGSIGVEILLKDGRKAEFQMIFFHDRNPWRTHWGGAPHWNQQPRLIDPSERKWLVPGKDIKGVKHILHDSPTLEVHCIGRNNKLKILRIKRDDFIPIRTRMDMVKNIDRAFEMLLLILSTITGALFQYLAWLMTPFSEYPLEQIFRFLFFPLIIAIVAWIVSIVVKNEKTKTNLKLFSWYYTMIVLGLDIEFTILWAYPQIKNLLFALLSSHGAALAILVAPLFIAIIPTYYALKRYAMARGIRKEETVYIWTVIIPLILYVFIIYISAL